MLVTLTSKGQVTLPASIRAALKLDAGMRLDFTLQDDGSIRVVPVSRDPLAVAAVLPKPPFATSLPHLTRTFDEMVRDIKARNAGLSAEEIDAAVAEALDWARAA